MREGDTVARLGGDEFVVMLEDLSDERYRSRHPGRDVWANKILPALSQQPISSAQSEHHSTPSIGITLFGEAPAEDASMSC